VKLTGSNAERRKQVGDAERHKTLEQLVENPPSHPFAPQAQLSLEQLRRLALDHHRADRIDDALKLYRIILTLKPDDSSVWCNLGVALRKQKHYQSAVNCYRRALAIKPYYPEALGNLANALKNLHRLDESLAIHRQVVQIRNDAQTLMNYASALREDGQFAKALVQLDRIKEIEIPDTQQAARIEWERAQNLLYLGRYREGWQAYEARWRTGELPITVFGRPQWQGEVIEGQTILLHAEQGYGDTILAARFIPQVKQRVGQMGKVILQCKSELHRLFQTVGADLLKTPEQHLPTIDIHCPLMSLMGALDIQPDTIPPPAQLSIPTDAQQKFAAMRFVSAIKIGIVWSGSNTFKNNDNRALPLNAFLPLSELPNVRLYSLQKGPRQVELKENGAEYYIEDIGTRCDDFADTAAAIENLDVIIMTDSSVAHLAASLNKLVINVIQKVPYWVYSLERDITPWYPSMRLIQHDKSGAWRNSIKTYLQL
jgi:tetratricopeptide (TPR) repeat protein